MSLLRSLSARLRLLPQIACQNQRRCFKVPRNILSLRERGFIQDTFPKEFTQDFATHLQEDSRVVYAGFDPTADSFHLGNLLIVLSLLHCQRAGHKVIVLLGGGTARIGDPSGKSLERPLLDTDSIDSNCEHLKTCLTEIFKNHAEHFKGHCKHDLTASVTFVDNKEWYEGWSLLDFISKLGRHFRVGTMLSRKSVRTRMESDEGLSFTEFFYQVLQAYDWLHLLRNYKCTVQIGGSDQLGNIQAGYDLIGRTHNLRVFGITVPLVLDEFGQKLGKSSGAPLWLSASKTSAFDFYQYFLRLPDKEVEKMLNLFSFLSESEIQDLMTKHYKVPEKRLPQKKLAEQLTLLVHGEEGLQSALTTTDVLYYQDISALAEIPGHEVSKVFQQASYHRILLSPGTTVLDLAVKIGCFKNEKDAIRVISAGGFYVNEVKCQNTEEIIIAGKHTLKNNTSIIRVGKKKYFVVDWT